MEASYSELDRAATLRDLISFSGQSVTIGGQSVRAFVERQAVSREASEMGMDDEVDERTVTFEKGKIAVDFETVIRIGKRKYLAKNIEPIGEKLLTLTIDLA